MKAELEQKSIDLHKWLEQTIKTTSDFGAEQIPLFIQELLVYHYWTSLSFFIFGVILFIALIYASYKFIKHLMKTDNMEYAPLAMFWIFPIAGACSLIANSTDWVMIQLAPRLYLLEYVKDMIKH